VPAPARVRPRKTPLARELGSRARGVGGNLLRRPSLGLLPFRLTSRSGSASSTAEATSLGRSHRVAQGNSEGNGSNQLPFSDLQALRPLSPLSGLSETIQRPLPAPLIDPYLPDLKDLTVHAVLLTVFGHFSACMIPVDCFRLRPVPGLLHGFLPHTIDTPGSSLRTPRPTISTRSSHEAHNRSVRTECSGSIKGRDTSSTPSTSCAKPGMRSFLALITTAAVICCARRTA